MGTTGLSITLANSIIGVGILAMPFCFQQCGILLASLILLSMGLVSRLCCYFLLKSSILARRRNFEFLAFHVFGPAGKFAVEIGIIGFLMGTCIAYFVVVGDLGPQIIAKMFNINQSDVLRTSIMVIVSLVCVLPLGLLRNVDSLSNVSAATIGFYFCLVIKVIAEAASELPSGEFYNMELWKPAGVLQCVPIFSMALFCQTQLFEIFESLPSLTLEKMNVVTKNAINICTAVYFTLGLFGSIAFSSKEISGNILMSLSPTMASDVIKLGFVMSVAFSFPLIIFPCRASLYSLLYKKVHSSQHDHIINHSIPETSFRCITVGIIAVTLFISLLIPNIELVLGLVGSTIGVLVCVLFPAACFLNLTFKNTNERVLAKGVLVLGLIILVLGTYANLQAAESKLDKYDDRYITREKIDKIVEDFFQKREKNNDQLLKSINSEPLNVINNINKNEIIKDSEVQPPNPVPPESNSLEIKSPETKIDTQIKNGNLDILLPEKLKEEAADKVSESHPKNLNKVIDVKANGIVTKIESPNEEKQPSNEEIKNEKLNIKQQQLIETMKQHGEEQKELMQEQKEILDSIINNQVNGEKVKDEKVVEQPKEVDKQQQLIDTIKQHGQEQKELMKEQKEILDEIIKTKKEIEQNKDSDTEAKKKAVESIKKIADIAIKSIGGVTEKPTGLEKEIKQSERLEQLTNDAVQEIAKKAVETIEAIQDIKINPENVPKPEQKDNNLVGSKDLKAPETAYQIPVRDIKQNPNINTNIKREISNNINNPMNKVQSNENKPNVQSSSIDKKVPEIQQNLPKTIINSSEIQQHLPKTIINSSEIQQNLPKTIINSSEIQQNLPKTIINSSEILALFSNKNEANKVHSHSPDEPQSYKVGEDIEIKKLKNKIDSNLPLALAMNGLKDPNQVKEAKAVPNGENSETNNVVKEKETINKQVPAEKTIPRQKREVVDCTKTMTLEPADRKICESLMIPKVKETLTKADEIKIPNIPQVELKSQRSEDFLPNVDLNEKLMRLPMDHHIGRSLKSYDEKKK